MSAAVLTEVRTAEREEALRERFFSKVNRLPDDGCWEWTASRYPTGYGKFWNGARVVYAHRQAWVLAHGEILKGMFVCHHCDNPACVRLEHLFLGTCRDNVRDMMAKGRHVSRTGDASGPRLHPDRLHRGDDCVNKKLTSEKVLELRALYAAGGLTFRALGARFGVSDQQAADVARRRSWRHLP